MPEEVPEESSEMVVKNSARLRRIVVETPIKLLYFVFEMVRVLPLEPFSADLAETGSFPANGRTR